MNFCLVWLMNSNDPTVTSALRFLAWDINLIATGGEAQHFPPAEGFFVRHSRLVFSLLILLLVVGLLWTIRSIGENRKGDTTPRPQTRYFAGIIIVGLVVLNAYLFLVLLPDQNVDLPVLLRFAPDLGLLVSLGLLLSIALGVACALLLIHARLPRRIVPQSG